MGVPFGTSAQISSISVLLTAMHPSVQSCRRVSRSNETISVGKAVNENISAGRDSQPRCSFAVFRIRIGDVDRFVEVAVVIARIEDVKPLGRTMISLSFLCAHWNCA